MEDMRSQESVKRFLTGARNDIIGSDNLRGKVWFFAHGVKKRIRGVGPADPFLSKSLDLFGPMRAQLIAHRADDGRKGQQRQHHIGEQGAGLAGIRRAAGRLRGGRGRRGRGSGLRRGQDRFAAALGGLLVLIGQGVGGERIGLKLAQSAVQD